MNEKRELAFYEKTWVIVLAFILFWPAGIALLAWRIGGGIQHSAVNDLGNLSDYGMGPEYGNTGSLIDQNRQAVMLRKSASKRQCRVSRIWGWVLIIYGFINGITITQSIRGSLFMLIATLTISLGCLIGGIFLLTMAKRQMAKWDLYETFIKPGGNTPVHYLVRKTGYKENTVRADLRLMVSNGFFVKPREGKAAYFDGEYDLLVMTKYGECMEPLKKSEPEPGPSREEQFAASNQHISGLRNELSRTKDEQLFTIISEIENSVRKIEEKVAAEPELAKMTNIRKLHGTYLPQTMDLIGKYNDGEGSDETRWEIRAMLETCAKAFKNIERKLYERDDIDTKVDIEVLKKTFEREGLLGSDFDLKKDFKPEEPEVPEETPEETKL